MQRKIGASAALLMAAAAMAGFGAASDRAAQAGQELREALQSQKNGDKRPGATLGAVERELLRRMSGGSRGETGGYLNRADWTNRRYQRAAAKRRNQARHRAACKGK